MAGERVQLGMGATLSDLEGMVRSELQREEALVKEQKDQPRDMRVGNP